MAPHPRKHRPMNRKLSATQILHGARAYSHNASRRAHQLSGPKRVRVMHGPVGNAALNDGIDSSCQHCGYQLCNCGPCATCGEVPYYCSGTHAYEPPKPSARALDNLGGEPSPEWLRMHAVVIERVTNYRVRIVGIEPGRYLVEFSDASNGWRVADDLKPAPSPVSEAPTAESDEAVLKRCGFLPTGNGRTGDAVFTGHHLHIGKSEMPEHAGQWFANYPTDGRPNAYAPTLLQAACAALGITLEIADPNGSEFFSGCYRAIAPNAGEYQGALVTATGDRIRDIETAARAALEAWSRREEPAS